MPLKVQFVISTGESSQATKKAQRRLIRSHVTSQRYSEKRKKEVKDHEELVQRQSTSPPTVDESASLNNPAIAVTAQIDDTIGDLPDGPRIVGDTSRAPDLFSEQSITHRASSSRDSVFLDQLSQYTKSHTDRPLPPSPYAYVGNGLSDPFISIPAVNNPRMPKHLFYYVNVLMPAMHPSYTTNLNRRTFGCKSMQYADELSLSGISAFSATSRAMESGDLVRHDAAKQNSNEGFHEHVFDWLYFKGHTINLINRRLSNDGQAIDDLTIGGICDLILLETYTGNIQEATLHMSGLSRIASLRQNTGPLPYTVASKITSSAVKLSTLTSTTPPIPFTLTYTPGLSLPLPTMHQILPALGTRLITLWPLIEPSTTLLPTIHDIVSATRCTEAVYYWIHPYAEDDTYYEYVNFQNLAIEYRVLSWGVDGGNGDGDGGRRQACVRLALLLYANTGLVRGYPVGAALIHNLVARLYSLLVDGAGSVEVWLGLEKVLFWMMAVGVHCSEGEVEEPFFVEKFRDLAGVMGFGSFEEVKGCLEGFLWVDRIYERRLRDVWGRFGL